jgi:hypothetical protein
VGACRLSARGVHFATRDRPEVVDLRPAAIGSAARLAAIAQEAMIPVMPSPASILERIDLLRDVPGYARIRDFLRQPTTKYYNGGGSNRVSVKQVDHAWGTRLMIARSKGLPPAIGSEHLVATISDLPKTEMLESVIFASEEELAAFWFIEANGFPVGFVLAERNMVDGKPVPL